VDLEFVELLGIILNWEWNYWNVGLERNLIISEFRDGLTDGL
jgi:hypothetical protein